MELLVQRPDQLVDIISSEIADIAEALTILRIRSGVVKVFARIKIIVQMNAVHIVMIYNL